jgi:hypothetical protein
VVEPSIAIEEHYDEDFEKTELEEEERTYKKEEGFEDEDDEKLVDEEFNLTSSEGSSGDKRDSDFLKELMKPPTRTKLQPPASKSIPTAKTNYESGEYVDEIDEFIKKHIENEETEAEEAKKQHHKRFSSASSHSSDDEDEGHNSGESEELGDRKSPREHLLECLEKLADPHSKYSLTDREMFLSDLEPILTVLSVKEVQERIIPALEIYS